MAMARGPVVAAACVLLLTATVAVLLLRSGALTPGAVLPGRAARGIIAGRAAPFKTVGHAAPDITPEGLLAQQLQRTDAESDPAAAAELHAALGRLHRTAGRGSEALQHLEAARDLAKRAGGGEPLAAASLALSEELLRQGKARAGTSELQAALATTGPGGAHAFAAAHRLGLAERKAGHIEAEIAAYERAKPLASSNEDLALLLSDLGQAHLSKGSLRGAIESLDHFQEALEVLHEPEGSFGRFKVGLLTSGMPEGRRAEIQAQLHQHIGRAHQTLAGQLSGDGWELPEAARHRREARRFDPKGAAGDKTPKTPKRDVVPLPSKDSCPLEWCVPGLTGACDGGSFSFRQPRSDPEDLLVEINGLLNDWKLKQAEKTVMAALCKESREGSVSAGVLNLLGRVRRAQEQYPEAAMLHERALAVALQRDAASPDVEEAYRQLSYVQASFHYVGRPEAAAKIHEAAVALAKGVPVRGRAADIRKDGERRIRANARPEPAAAVVATTL